MRCAGGHDLRRQPVGDEIALVDAERSSEGGAIVVDRPECGRRLGHAYRRELAVAKHEVDRQHAIAYLLRVSRAPSTFFQMP